MGGAGVLTPILYKNDEMDFDHHGLGDLVDCISAHVIEQRNGKYDLEFVYPTVGRHFDEIKDDMIVKAKANDTDDDQLFRIYSHSEPIDFKVTFKAHHISYDLMYNPLEKTTLAGNTLHVMGQVIEGALNPHPFNVFSDNMAESTSEIGPCHVREALGGTEGSILDNWGGEYHFDNFLVENRKQRGLDTGVTIEYGKNLTDYNQDRELENVFTSVYPYANKQTDDGGQQLIILPEKIIHLASEGQYPVKRTLMLDLSQDESVTDADSLRAAAQKYAQNNKIDRPSVSWAIKFQDLRKTEDYKNIAALEQCGLCDYVIVRFSRYSIFEKAEIIEVDYDVLKEQYISIDLGDPVSNFVTDFQDSQKETRKVISPTGFLQQAINKATQAITGQSGGYVRLNPALNPQEILIMNTPDIATATKVWRWNLGGLGYSKHGYNGPYELAMTMDGEIVANFITAGVLRGILIEGTNIHALNPDKSFDAWLNSDGFNILKNGQTKFKVDADGNLDTYGASIHGGSIEGSSFYIQNSGLQGWLDGNGLNFVKDGNPVFHIGTDGSVNTYGAALHGGSIDGSSFHVQNGAMNIWLDGNGFHMNVNDFDILIDSTGIRALKGGTEVFSVKPDGSATFSGIVLAKDDNGNTAARLHSNGLEFYKDGRFLASLGRIFTADQQGIGLAIQDGDFVSINRKDGSDFPFIAKFERNTLGLYAGSNHYITLGGGEYHMNIGDSGFEMDHGIFRVTSAGTYRMVVQPGETGLWTDLNMNGWTIKNANIQSGSLESLKQDIKLMQQSALEIISAADIYSFRMKKDVKEGRDFNRYGVVIGKNRRTPKEFLSEDKAGVDHYNEIHLLMKAVQELSAKVDKLEGELHGKENY
jgi:phage minor structural protein